MTKAVLSAMIRPLVEPRLPEWVEPLWFASKEQALEFAPQAEIGWFDLNEKEPMIEIARAATKLKWMNSIYAGLDFMPLDLLPSVAWWSPTASASMLITIAEYVVMLMLAHAKGYREVVRAQDRNEWLLDSPGKRELAGERVLLLGMGAIGSLIKTRLEAFDMTVVACAVRAPMARCNPGEWRRTTGRIRLGRARRALDPETSNMIGAMELAAMRPNGVLVNIARGDVVDQPALVEALSSRKDRSGAARRHRSRTAARGSPVVGPRQCAGHHAPVGARADQDVPAQRGSFHRKPRTLAQGRTRAAAARSRSGLLTERSRPPGR